MASAEPTNASRAPAPSFTDVTQVLDNLANELPMGGMVQHKEFSLHRSMSAVELMDPKMDTGMHTLLTPTVEERLQSGDLPLKFSVLHAARIIDCLVAHEVAHRCGCSLPTSILPCLYADDEALAGLRQTAASVIDVPTNDSSKGYNGGSDDDDLDTHYPLTAAAVYVYTVAMLKCCRIFYNVVKAGDIYEDEEFCDYERYPGGKRGPRLRLDLGDRISKDELDGIFESVILAIKQKLISGTSRSNEWQALLARVEHRCSYFQSLSLLLPLSVPIGPKAHDSSDNTIETTIRVRKLVSEVLVKMSDGTKNTHELSKIAIASMGCVWGPSGAEDIAEVERAGAEEKAEADKKKLESDRPQGVEEIQGYDNSVPVLERASITQRGKLRYGIDQDFVKEFFPTGPPRKMNELVIPSKAYSTLNDHLSHLDFVCKCHERVVSCEDFEKNQAIANGKLADTARASVMPRSSTTLLQLHDYLEEFAGRNADIFARSVMVLLISGPLMRPPPPKPLSGDSSDSPKSNQSIISYPALLLGRDILVDVIDSSLLEYGIAPWMLKNEAFGMDSRKLLLPVVLAEMRLFCMAPARLHRRANRTIQEWGAVQNDVDYLDSAMLGSVNITGEATRTFCNRFGSWVLDRAMGLMVRQLLIGFQLDLYAEQEYVSVYWYCERITQMRIQNRDAARRAYFARDKGPQPDFSFASKLNGDSKLDNVDDGFTSEVLVATNVGSKSKKKRGKKGKKGKKKSKHKNKAHGDKKMSSTTSTAVHDSAGKAFRLSIDLPRHDRHIHYRALTELDMHRTLFRSYACILVILREYGFLKETQQYSLGSDKLRFQHRFQQFKHFNQPSPIHFEELESYIRDIRDKKGDLFDMVKLWFSQAAQKSKVVLSHCPYASDEFRMRLRAIAKLCVINGISLQTLAKSVPTSDSPAQPPSHKAEIKFNFSGKDSNKYYPTITQSERK